MSGALWGGLWQWLCSVGNGYKSLRAVLPPSWTLELVHGGHCGGGGWVAASITGAADLPPAQVQRSTWRPKTQLCISILPPASLGQKPWKAKKISPLKIFEPGFVYSSAVKWEW